MLLKHNIQPTPTPQPAPQATPTPQPAPHATPMPQSAPQATPQPAPQATPTSMPQPTPQPAPTPQPTPQPTPTPLAGGKFTFRWPFAAIVAAPSMGGKTKWVQSLFERQQEMISPSPDRIIWIYGQWQPAYEEMLRSLPNIQFTRGIPANLDDPHFLDTSQRHLLVFDDVMNDLGKNEAVTNLYTKGCHHRNLSVITLLQNFYHPATVTMRRNSHYLVLFDMPGDQQVINTISQRMYPDNPKYLLTHWKQAVAMPYGQLVVDLRPNTSRDERLQINILEKCQKKAPTLQERSGISPASEPLQERFAACVSRSSSCDSLLDMPSCDDCGLVFDHITDLQRHIKFWCPEQCRGSPMKPGELGPSAEEKMICCNEMEWIECKKEDEEYGSIWKDLINEAYTIYDIPYTKRLRQLESGGMTRTDAGKQTSDEFFPKYRKSLTDIYKKLVWQLYELQKCQLHRRIMDMVKTLEVNGDHDFKEALDLTFQKKKYLLDDVLDDQHEEEEDDTDSE